MPTYGRRYSRKKPKKRKTVPPATKLYKNMTYAEKRAYQKGKRAA